MRLVKFRFGYKRSVMLALVCGLAFAQESPGPPRTLATFEMAELFGVGWQDQPIEFRYDGGRPPAATTHMIGPGGAEVPWQWVTSCSDATAVKGCILVRSGLPANANYKWTLETGVSPVAAIPAEVKLTRTGSSYEVTNGLTGVRISSPEGNPRPWNHAPIQGILLPGGVWTGVGATPNLLYAERASFAGDVGTNLTTPMSTATGYNVTITDSGPLKVVIKATYTFNRPRYAFGKTLINEAGPGHYTLIMTMYAGSKSILLDEDSDMLSSWYLPLFAQLQPDQARYRGQDSLDSSNVYNPICGYEGTVPVTTVSTSSPVVIGASVKLNNGQRVAVSGLPGIPAANGTFYAKTAGYPNGQFALYLDSSLTKPVAGAGDYTSGGIVKPAYRGSAFKQRVDGYLDITYTSNRIAAYTCNAGSYRKLLTAYPPAAHSAGFYTMIYRANAGVNAPVVGFYVGRPSQQQYAAVGPSQAGLYSSDKHWITGARDAGIQVDTLLRGADGSKTSMVHRNWAIWVGTHADLLAPEMHQPINEDQNALTGINLSRLYTYQLVYPDPPGGWKWSYLSPLAAGQLVASVRDGTRVCGSPGCYYTQLFNSDGSVWGRALLQMWKGNSTAAVQKALDAAVGLAKTICVNLTTGGNHFGTPAYYEMGLYTTPASALLNAILMDNNATQAQKTVAKAALALFGSMFWDNDWFPVENETGEGGGLANQRQQYLQYRALSVSAAPSQPFLAAKLPAAVMYAKSDFSQSFSETGAAAGSTHYQNAFFEPLILNYETLSRLGLVSMIDPKWNAYANWELSVQTPPEPRFGNLRKAYSNGDGNTEADVRTGMLATALSTANPTLAGNLMWAWRQSNSPKVLTEDTQFVTTLYTIDNTIPVIVPVLSSTNIPGYHSVERFGFGTPNETALWFINGGFYSSGGHRHADDGQVSIYAHSAPLAIDWNANLYSPPTPGRFMHNSIVFDEELKHPWSADNAELTDADVALRNPVNTEYASFTDSTTSSANFTAEDGTLWTRTVRMMHFDPAYPVIYVNDAFTGPGAAKGKTLTWNLMATGAVTTPAGAVNPIVRLSQGCKSPAAALPSNGKVFGLPAGLQAFAFTGATWRQHSSSGINWDLYTLANTSSGEFFVGNWGHGCHSSREMGEYQAANGGPFAEVQHILRVHDTGPFTTIILPYRKTDPPSRTVTKESCGVRIRQGPQSTCFNGSSATFTSGSSNVLTAFDSSPQTAFGINVSGGPQEVVAQPDRIVWTIGGNQAGPRVLNLPEAWYPDQRVSTPGKTYRYAYKGGAQAAPVTFVFTKTPQP